MSIDIVQNPTAATAILLLANIGAGDTGLYRCILTDSCGSQASNAATLTVCAVDLNCDQVVDFFDYFDFVNAFAGALPAADFNHDGALDVLVAGNQLGVPPMLGRYDASGAFLPISTVP